MLDKLGKRKLYVCAKNMFKDIEFPESKLCEYYFCSRGNSECLSFSRIVLVRNCGSGIFILYRGDGRKEII